MSFHSGGSHLETDGYWHARLLSKLSAEVSKQELKNFKQLIRSSRVAPNQAIDEAKNFFALWGVLERQDLIKPGEYSFLRDNFEMLNRKDLAAMINAHYLEVEEFRRTQSKKVSTMAEEDDDPILNSFVVVQLSVK